MTDQFIDKTEKLVHKWIRDPKEQDVVALETEEDLTLYRVAIQGTIFECAYTDAEMRGIVKTCSGILQELKHVIDENGITLNATIKHMLDTDRSSPQLVFLRVYTVFSTPIMEDLIEDLGRITRSSRPQYILLARPTFAAAIYSVFDFLMRNDEHDSETVWSSALYFLVRAAMFMHPFEKFFYKD